MFLSIYVLSVLSIEISIINAETEDGDQQKLEISRNCRERNRLINTEKGDLYAIIDASIGEKLTLLCHYCEENDDGRPKIWYKMEKFGKSNVSREVELGMENNSTRNRIHVNPQHSLIINNFTEYDKGLYYCARTEVDDGDERYNYFVEPVYDVNVTTIETGNFTAWKQYYEDYFAPINVMFAESHGKEFTFLRDEQKIKLELVTQWDPFGICEVCGRPQGQGFRKRKGYCRIKLTQKLAIDTTDLNDDELVFAKANAVSCRSMALDRTFPGISNLTKIIPHFVQTEKCEGICNPDAEGVNAGWKAGKTKGFKYRKSYVMQEHDHLAVVCPESTLENTVVWRLNGKILKPGHAVEPEEPDEEPRIIIDTFNTLYLVNVKKTEEGNYTCQVDSIRMQQLRIYVASKSRLLTNTLLRHLVYLGFILALTATCYCAGLVITYNKRDTFKGYEELREMHKADADYEDSDSSV